MGKESRPNSWASRLGTWPDSHLLVTDLLVVFGDLEVLVMCASTVVQFRSQKT